MKAVKFYFTTLFLVAIVFASCNPHPPKDNADSQVSSEGLDSPTTLNIKKDSTLHNDTIVTPTDDNNMNKNNPDITK